MSKKWYFFILVSGPLVFDLIIQLFNYVTFDPLQEAGLASPPSVVVAGYNSQRTGVVKSTLPLNTKLKLIEKVLPIAQGATKAMPLFLNTDDLAEDVREKFPKTRGKYLIFGTVDGRIVFYDLEHEQPYLNLKVSSQNDECSMAISLKWGKLYFKNSTHFYSINIDGSGLQSIQISLEEVVAKKIGVARSKLPVDCMKTALGINEQATNEYIFQGCATGRDYGVSPGAVGHLFAIYLDAAGNYIDPIKYKTFVTSVRTTDQRTGFNTGIWNTGMGPTLTSDNKILIATGNGPFYPKQKNYGCSVIKIDGNLFDVESVDDYYSMDHFDSQECMRSNLGIGSSSVAFVEHQSQQYAVVTGKDGVLRIFDPRNMPRNDPRLKKEIKFGGEAYGQPLIFVGKDGKVQVAVTGNLFTEEKSRTEFFLATDEMVQQVRDFNIFDGTIEKKGCIGFLQKKGREANRMSLYYSGRIRRDFVLIRNNDDIVRQMKTFVFDNKEIDKTINWYSKSSYNKLFNRAVGYSVKTLPPELQERYRLLPLTLSAGLARKVSLNSSPHMISLPYEQEGRDIVISNDNGQIISLKKAQRGNGDNINFCGEINDQSLIKLNLYSIVGERFPVFTKWNVGVYNIDSKLEFEKVWERIYSDGDTRHPRSNMAGIQTENGNAIVITPYRGTFFGNSELKLLSLEDGKELGAIPFSGFVHFSMPLIVGNKIFVSTMGTGIKMFIIKFWSFGSYFWKHSYLFGWNL